MVILAARMRHRIPAARHWTGDPAEDLSLQLDSPAMAASVQVATWAVQVAWQRSAAPARAGRQRNLTASQLSPEGVAAEWAIRREGAARQENSLSQGPPSCADVDAVADSGRQVGLAAPEGTSEVLPNWAAAGSANRGRGQAAAGSADRMALKGWAVSASRAAEAANRVVKGWASANWAVLRGSAVPARRAGGGRSWGLGTWLSPVL